MSGRRGEDEAIIKGIEQLFGESLLNVFESRIDGGLGGGSNRRRRGR